MRTSLSIAQVARDSRSHYLMNKKAVTGMHDRGFTDVTPKRSL